MGEDIHDDVFLLIGEVREQNKHLTETTKIQSDLLETQNKLLQDIARKQDTQEAVMDEIKSSVSEFNGACKLLDRVGITEKRELIVREAIDHAYVSYTVWGSVSKVVRNAVLTSLVVGVVTLLTPLIKKAWSCVLSCFNIGG